MRYARLICPILIALSAAACSRQQAISYVQDPSTGQMVPVVQRYGETTSAQAQAQPQQDAGQAQAQAQPQYAEQAQAQPQYAQDYDSQQPAVAQGASPGRGLFTSGLFGRRHRANQISAQDTAQTAEAQAPGVPQSFVMQYRPPQASAPQAAPPPATVTAQAPASSDVYAYAPAEQPYTLDSGDKLRIVVFGQGGISSDYLVDAQGRVTLPLVGSVPARGRTTGALERAIATRLKQGYVRNPHVTVSVATYRPFFILGEVTTPGQYPYVPNMTAENAVAIAGGFSPRAYKDTVQITSNVDGQTVRQKVPLNYRLRPGDTVMVKERWF